MRDRPGREHGRHGGGHSRRLFDHGELRLVVLALVAERPRHGYEVIKAIEDRAGGAYSPSPGVVYPTLALLEELGHATVAREHDRRLYAATPAGAAHLAASRPALDRALDRLRAAGAAHGAGGGPEILRATENLKLALRLRLRGGELTPAQTRVIAEALDTAALAVERS